jgi:aminoglycoside phosphotransferase (APT) family kinase protein
VSAARDRAEPACARAWLDVEISAPIDGRQAAIRVAISINQVFYAHSGRQPVSGNRGRSVHANVLGASKMTEINIALVKQLIRTQFPQWTELPVAPVENGGWDNRTFRLGDSMSIRLPSALCYVAQVEKEHRWLPVLRSHLPLPIPFPIGLGAPGEDYPWPWSIYGWLDGESAHAGHIHDIGCFAVDLAHFLVALRRIDARSGPIAGAHNFHRGGSLAVYDTETRQSVTMLADEIDIAAVMEVWDMALQTSWQGPPVWVHGDVAESNLLVKDGRLSAVIDFGCTGVGDPSCDLVIAWTSLDPASREQFRSAVALDPATWQRARGWALWKALITLAQFRDTNLIKAEIARQVIRDVLRDHFRAGSK